MIYETDEMIRKQCKAAPTWVLMKPAAGRKFWKEVLEGMEEIIFELVQELEDLPILQVKHITAGFFDGDMILIK